MQSARFPKESRSLFEKGTARSRRGRLNIIVDILKTAKYGERKTRIMYHAKLSYAQLESYLGLLERNKLIQNLNGKYETTEKGLKLLEEFKSINLLLSEFSEPQML